MARVTKSITAKKRHKKILKSTKGSYGARSRLYKTAKQSNIKALQYAFRDRKNKKRNFRALWIARINAGSSNVGVPYSKLINSLSKKNIVLNRKILADLAVNDQSTFEKVVNVAIN
ncbi:MAG: 50S ribosomal protein L20 [Flavobacteriales bacterium]|jgi:large subunit ribosomal protein L20|nr:50S ribosomal protein L20 [Flavobacteriales bacterium]|tara:strand:+ start:582 stop:929 length:348 start_codon:yes stop_codon:yes gene_type:complete